MSSVDSYLRDMIREEVERLLLPLSGVVEQLRTQNSRIASALGQPVRRGPGRPPKLIKLATSLGRRGPGRPPKLRKNASQTGRHCAVKDCRRPARSKGYCAAHYQKFRMLSRTHRLPPGWVADASPNSVSNIVLPRGRAGAKALSEAKKKR